MWSLEVLLRLLRDLDRTEGDPDRLRVESDVEVDSAATAIFRQLVLREVALFDPHAVGEVVLKELGWPDP